MMMIIIIMTEESSQSKVIRFYAYLKQMKKNRIELG